MPLQVVLPKLDRLMTEGVVQKWLRKSGEEIRKGEPIALIETEKVTVELDAPESGTIIPRAAEGSRQEVGQVIALILSPGEKIPEILQQGVLPKAEETSPPSKRSRMGPESVRGTPAARKLARELGVELTQVRGSGPGGSIVLKDVAAHAKGVKPARAEPSLDTGSHQLQDESIPLTGWRKTMAERMARSAATTARVTTVAEVDATELVSLREQLKTSERSVGAQMTYTTLIVKAVAKALTEYPLVNSTLVGDMLTIHKDAHIGVAVALKAGGLVVPVVHDADKKNLIEISRELKDLTEKAHENRLALENLSGGTFTITNPGMMGVIMDTPIINAPQTAILGVGAIVKRPTVVGDEIAIRQIMYLSLSYDHRVIEGAPAIQFLQKVRQLIESPDSLFAGVTA